MARVRLRLGVPLLVVLACAGPGVARAAPPSSTGAPPGEAVGWATNRAADLTGEARRLTAAGQPAEALVRLREALAMDATYAPAYLELAAAREANGDLREAEQVLSMALERLPDLAEAHERRANLRSRRGDLGGAAADLERALADRPLDFALHERVVGAWIRARMPPRALAAARRWRAATEGAEDPAASRRATVHAAALARLVDHADPVGWSEGRGGVRGLLARAARDPRPPGPISPRTSR